MTRVDGGRELERLGRRLHGADRELMRELRHALEQGVAPLSGAILESIPPHIPRDFEATLADAMIFRTATRTAGRRTAVEHVTTAKGKTKLRKIGAMNEGVLKHPIHGRTRRLKSGRVQRNPWHRQRITRGFWTEPVDENKTYIRSEARAAMHRVGRKITEG